jgi:hypothetical protein
MAKMDTATTLAFASRALKVLEQEGAGLSAARDKALLDGASATEISKLDKQIEVNRHAAATEKDRIRLLEGKLVSEQAEQQEREKQKKISQVLKDIAVRDAAGSEVADAIAMLDRGFRKMWTASRKIREAWPWDAGQQSALLIGDQALVQLVQYETFRVGSRPALGGGQFPVNHDGPSLPGGKSPRLEWLQQPEKIPALTDQLKQVATWADAVMRTGQAPEPVVEVSTPAPKISAEDAAIDKIFQRPEPDAPVPVSQQRGVNPQNVHVDATAKSSSGRTIAQLWNELSRLSNMEQTPDVERQHAALVAELAEVS